MLPQILRLPLGAQLSPSAVKSLTLPAPREQRLVPRGEFGIVRAIRDDRRLDQRDSDVITVRRALATTEKTGATTGRKRGCSSILRLASADAVARDRGVVQLDPQPGPAGRHQRTSFQRGPGGPPSTHGERLELRVGTERASRRTVVAAHHDLPPGRLRRYSRNFVSLSGSQPGVAFTRITKGSAPFCSKLCGTRFGMLMRSPGPTSRLSSPRRAVACPRTTYTM